MDKGKLKKYAIWARRELIKGVDQRAVFLGIIGNQVDKISKDSNISESLTSGFTDSSARKDVINYIKEKGYNQFVEEVACKWFIRLIALRYLEANDYLPGKYQFFSDLEVFQNSKQIKDSVKTNLSCSAKSNNNNIKDFNLDEGLFRHFIIEECDSLNSFFPKIFQKKDDYTNILLPYNLLEENSIIQELVGEIPSEYWKDNVQIIGWLFQYYNSELKNKIFEDLNKNIKISKEKIPTATQLFTPEWIVRYMVENSLGRFWLDNYDNPELKNNWKYYIDEAEQNKEVKIILEELKQKHPKLRLKEIKCIDPCMGSGNIICYLFDVLFQMYKEVGYESEEAVESILNNNLFGLDIDERVSDIAYLSLMLKARQFDKDIFKRKVYPQICAITESNDISNKFLNVFCKGDKAIIEEVCKLVKQMKDAKTYGSLIKITNIDFNVINKRVEEIASNDRKIKNSLELQSFIQLIKVAEILFQKYDVVITNPPYMGGSGMNHVLTNFMRSNYPDTKTDLFAAFLERGLDMAKADSYSCMVTMQNWMFIPSFEKIRKKIINNHTIVALLHMENMIMGIAFGTAVSILRNTKIPDYIANYNHIKYSDIQNDEPYTFPVPQNKSACISSEKFKYIPSCPIAYWATSNLFEAYKKGVIGDRYEAAVGIQTGDNDRFLRYWFEIPIEEIDFNKNEKRGYKKRWYPHPKGGAFQKWYGNYDYVVNWQNDGEDIRRFNNSKITIKKYNRNGICWSHTTNGAFSARKYYESSIPNLENPILFCDGKEQKYLLALLNSKVVNYLLNMINSTMHYHVSDVLHLPLLFIDNPQKIENISDESVELVKKDWDSYELSWNFLRHPLCKKDSNLISEIYKKYEKDKKKLRDKLIKNEEYLNKEFIVLYGLQNELDEKIEDKSVSIKKTDRKKDIESFLSYAVGCMFGRYSLDFDEVIYSGGEWHSDKYISYIPEKNNIVTICEDNYFENDVVSMLEDFLIKLYGKGSLEDNLCFIAESIGGEGQPRQVIRKYFINSFFKNHCKLYRKRPIYWLFDSGKKNSFKCLIYAHRYNKDLLSLIKNKYISSLKKKYNTLLEEVSRKMNVSKSKADLKLRNKYKEQLEELNLFEEKILQIEKSNISIDLDDGIKNNYALFQSVLADIK